MSHPLIDRLTSELGYLAIDAAMLDDFLDADEDRVLFVTGDPDKNLESADVAVILPELVRAFGGRFRVGVVDRAIERPLRERFDVWPTPSLIFVRRGQMTGAIAKVRDWDDYISEIRQILSRTTPVAAA